MPSLRPVGRRMGRARRLRPAVSPGTGLTGHPPGQIGLALFAAVALFAWSTTAGAQTAGPPTMPSAPAATATGQKLSFQARLDATYTSNLAGGNDQIAAIRQVTPGDVVYNALMSGSFQLARSRSEVFLNASASINRHAENQNLDGADYTVSSGLTDRVGPCAVVATGSYSRNQTAPADLLIAVTKNISQVESANGSLTCAAGPLVTGLTGSASKVTNSGAGLLGNGAQSVSGSIGYGGETLGIISLFGQYSQSTQSGRPQTGQRILSPPTQVGGGLSYQRTIGKRLVGSASVSYVHVRFSGLAQDGIDASLKMKYQLGLRSNLSVNYSHSTQVASSTQASQANNLNANLSYRLSQRGTVSIGYRHATEASQLASALLERSDSVLLSGTYSLSSRLTMRGGITAERAHFDGGLPSALQVRQNRSVTENLGLDLTIGRNLALTMNANHSDRSADLQQFNFSSNSVSIGLSSTF